MAILVDTPGLFVGYGPSSLSFYVTEARSERGQQSLDYRIDAMQQDPYAHPPDSMVAQINAKTVVSRDSLVTIALWANVLTDEPYGGSGIFLNALGREFKRRGHTVIHNSQPCVWGGGWGVGGGGRAPSLAMVSVRGARGQPR